MNQTTETFISLYQKPKKIYPRKVSGFFTSWRWLLIWLTQIFFYGVPWIDWGHRQALLFSIEHKRFYIFNLVLYPQDLIYLTAILIIAALSLFLFTAVAGRLWCGYACPQSVYTEIFLWIERKVEGDRAARMKLDDTKMTYKKFAKKFAKHFVWIVFALWTGFTFVGYFTPIRELTQATLSMSLGSWETFWIWFYGFATYGNAGFMREQICKYMCPYARFQSAMFDDDTLIVTYDEARGEPRGGRSRNAVIEKAELGSCIDCSLCVQVCPTGIDIREGLQYECIGCGACVDACDSIMDKMGYARGLIKYSTQNAIENIWSQNQMLRRILRPRVLVYATILFVLIISILTSLWLRTSFRVDVSRDAGVMARLAEGGMIENVYRVQITNNTESIQHYRISANGIDGIKIRTESQTQPIGSEAKRFNAIRINPTESKWVIVDLSVQDGTIESGSHSIKFEIESIENQERVAEKSVFLMPK